MNTITIEKENRDYKINWQGAGFYASSIEQFKHENFERFHVDKVGEPDELYNDVSLYCRRNGYGSANIYKTLEDLKESCN